MEVQHGSRVEQDPSLASDSSGPYVLRDVIKDIPLGEQEDGAKAYITCVDAWNGNLYVGTSSGQVLHYVSIPPEPSDDPGQPSYIFATKLEPPYTHKQDGADAGVKQILLLPLVSKACILCNGTLTFYTLPELSPAFGGKIKQGSCLWVGGIDAAEIGAGGAASGTIVVLCLKQRLRLIRVGDEPRPIRSIELGGVTSVQRRQDLACVADGRAYSLLDLVNQRKNELFPISSLNIPEPPEDSRPTIPLPKTREPSRSFSSASPVRLGRTHERNISLGGEPRGSDHLQPDSGSPWPARRSSRLVDTTSPPATREESPALPSSTEASKRASDEFPRPFQMPSRPLPSNILTPTSNEFLLTTGTALDEPGVGVFVNNDGDVVRGTLEFTTYPRSLVLDGPSASHSLSESEENFRPGYVLGLVSRVVDGKSLPAIEIQRWDVDVSEAGFEKHWLHVPSLHEVDEWDVDQRGVGLRTATAAAELTNPEISINLRLRRLEIGNADLPNSNREKKREEEEDKFTSRFAQVFACTLLYYDDRIAWVTPNPLIVRLEKLLSSAVSKVEDKTTIDVPAVRRVFNSIRGQDATNELEFVTLTYIRQKASLLLFGNLLLQAIDGSALPGNDNRQAEEALIDGEIDPRVILSLMPTLAVEVDQGDQGIWISQGLRDTVNVLRESTDTADSAGSASNISHDSLLQLIKRYLLAWRKKKGFGSVADEVHVFRTVDAALLHVLLMLDEHSPRGPAMPGSTRAELNDVVDRGVDCFDRAAELFEQYHRLYVLSRLYQSRKMTGQVLATWKRILEGEHDAGGELIEGEQDIRKYLTKLRDAALVRDYGTWLANRNPKLGVQVFADDSSRVRFDPQEAVGILKEKAPSAVKDYLEHLVFGKNHVQYVNDLIAYYLDTVLTELQGSAESRQLLLQSYETYRALKPPKPTYRQFITDNAIEADWWANRLRLLQLIGGSHGAASRYNVTALRQRLQTYSEELVPEMIILNGREGKHEEALRMLTHALGDYDTAIRYCLLGGSSIFHPTGSSGLSAEIPLPAKDEQSQLFDTLLHQFFRIDEPSERLERTAELLERFGGWFDIEKVLALIPDDWSVELVSSFLVRALRRLVRERNETEVVKALSSAQNLKKAVEFAEKTEVLRPVVVKVEGQEVAS